MVQCCLTMVLLEELSFCLHSSLMVVMALSYSLFLFVLLPPLLLSLHLSFFPLSLPSCFLHFLSLYFFPLLHSSCFIPLSSLDPLIPLFHYPLSLLFLSFISPSLFASFILSLSFPPPQHANWMCPSCVQAVKAEEDRHKPSSSNSLSVQQSSKEVQTPSTNPGGCNCAACVAKRWGEHYCRRREAWEGGLICEPGKSGKFSQHDDN